MSILATVDDRSGLLSLEQGLFSLEKASGTVLEFEACKITKA